MQAKVPARRPGIGWALYAIVALITVASIGYLTYLALDGFDLIEAGEAPGPVGEFVIDGHDALPWTLAALAGTLIGLGLWARDRRRAELVDDAEEDRRAAEGQLAAAREELERAEARKEEAAQLAESRADELAVLRRARERERDWTARLREELREHQRGAGVLGSGDEVPALVLRMTLSLLDAEKGLLVSGFGESERRLVAWEGFENDPEQSALARRFASAVLDREEIVRERREDLDELPEDDATPADREIENLIAIPIYIADEFHGAVVCANSDDIENHDEQVLLALGNQAGAILDNATLRGELRDAYVSTVGLLAEAIRAKDPHLGGHCHQVSGYVSVIADRLGLDAQRREELVFASLLHDVGKIGISERILLKPGRLTDEEYTVVKLHPRIGAQLVRQVPALSPLGQYILHHHERFDGTGYPTGLRGEEIPLEARVIGVVDAFSAMTSDRPYRGRMSLDEACAELEAHAGTQFDPEIVRLFVEAVQADPPSADDPNPALEALADPELASLRGRDDGPLVGVGALDLTDHLTLLYTHRYFHEAAQAEAQRAEVQERGFGVAIFELTAIRELNRNEGYAAGDAAIKRVAHAVEQQAVRWGGTAARYSGRRIALMVPGGEGELGTAVAAVCEADGAGLRASTSVWLPGDTGDDVVARAVAGLRTSLAEQRPAA